MLFASIAQSQLAKYQNNYRLESHNPFKSETVDKLVETILSERLAGFSYDTSASAKLCAETAADIQRNIQQLKYDRYVSHFIHIHNTKYVIVSATIQFFRYKIVVSVTIMDKASQSMEASMGFLWDNQRDHYSTYTFEAHTFFAYCFVFGLYYE